jgi:nicotinamidase-related amidase
VARPLVIIDIQNDYFPGGRSELVGADAAAERAAEVLAGFRERGEQVVHLQHVWDAPDAEFFAPGTSGVEINDAVAPAGGEPVIQKAFPNGFQQTDLEPRLRDGGADELVLCGMMTSMCVDATVRAAVDLGFECTVVHDACATKDLSFDGRSVAAADVHAAFLAALGDGYAALTSASDV